jgi:hypothetical protein
MIVKMDWNRYGRKRLWSLKALPQHLPEGKKEIKIHLKQDGKSLG